MPTTPAQLREMIASAVTTALTNQQPLNRDLFNSESNSVASIGMEIENLGGNIMREGIHEVPANLYRRTTSITNEALKRNRFPDFNSDNSKRKAAILIIFKSEYMLTLIFKVRSKLIKSFTNPNKYTPRRCITKEETLNSDDEYLYPHDINRLYLAMTICVPNQIKYLCPVATVTSCGMILWNFTNNHVFGTEHKEDYGEWIPPNIFNPKYII